MNEELEPLAERVGNHVPLMQARKAAGTADFFVNGDSDRLERFGQAHLEEVQRQGLPWVMEGWGYFGVAAFVRGDWEAARSGSTRGNRASFMGIGKGWNAGPLFECLAYLGDRTQALALLDDRAHRIARPWPAERLGGLRCCPARRRGGSDDPG